MLGLARRYDVQVLSLSVTRTLGNAYAQSGRLPEGLALLRQAVAMMESIGHRRPYATASLIQLGWACLLDSRTEEALTLAGRSLAQARARGERGFEAYALHLLGDVTAKPDRPDVAEAHYREAIALAAELDMRPLLARCHRGLGEFYRRAGQNEPACEHLAQAETMSREMDLRDPSV